MSYTITNLITDVSSVIHGTTANKVPNIYGHINRAARAVLLDVDPKETQRIVSLAQVFNNVYDYAAPTDIKGDRTIDIRPQAGRTPFDIFTQDYALTFDSQKGFNLANAFYTQWNTGVKSLRIEAPTLTAPVTLSDTGSTTGWAATTGASTITIDTQNNVAGGGDLTFNLLASSSSGYIENSALTQLDLTTHQFVSTLFMWVYLPTAASVTSVELRWGSSPTAYYAYTATTTQQGTAFQNGWNLLAFPWISASTTGSPTITAMDTVRVTFNYNSTLQTGVKVCNITSALGYYFQLQYYSKYLFRNATTNAFQETVVDTATDAATIINLDTESYNLLFNKTAFYVAQALQGSDAQYDAIVWDTEYTNALKRYKAQNPSEALLKGESYYSMPNKSYGKYNPGGSIR